MGGVCILIVLQAHRASALRFDLVPGKVNFDACLYVMFKGRFNLKRSLRGVGTMRLRVDVQQLVFARWRSRGERFLAVDCGGWFFNIGENVAFTFLVFL